MNPLILFAYFLIGLLFRNYSDTHLFGIHEPSTEEWIKQIVIFKYLTAEGKLKKLRVVLDWCWSLIRFVFWPMVLMSDLMLKGWYNLKH
jgi:hypothetical protein